jgi:hypothetical protein
VVRVSARNSELTLEKGFSYSYILAALFWMKPENDGLSHYSAAKARKKHKKEF